MQTRLIAGAYAEALELASMVTRIISTTGYKSAVELMTRGINQLSLIELILTDD